MTFNQVVPGSSPGCLISVKRLKALIYKALSRFFDLLEYIDLTKICVILMSQTCRKFHNVAILSHRFNRKYWQLQTDNLPFLQVYDCIHL